MHSGKKPTRWYGSATYVRSEEEWHSESNSQLWGVGAEGKKEKGKEKARQVHLRGVIGKDINACSVREGLVGGHASEEPSPGMEVLLGPGIKC